MIFFKSGVLIVSSNVLGHVTPHIYRFVAEGLFLLILYNRTSICPLEVNRSHVISVGSSVIVCVTVVVRIRSIGRGNHVQN